MLIAACVYDDQFVYANDRYKMAGQWFGLPKLFPASENLGYEIVRNDDTLIQFKNKQVRMKRAELCNALIPALVVPPHPEEGDDQCPGQHRPGPSDERFRLPAHPVPQGKCRLCTSVQPA